MRPLKDFILVVEDALTGKQCDDLIKYHEHSEWEQSLVNVNGQAVVDDHRTCEVQVVVQPNSVKLMQSQCDLAIREYLARVKPEAIETIGNSGFDMLRYNEGGQYKEHVDHYAQSPRQLSLSWALNDGFEGGEWGFWGNQYKVSIPKGALMIFPSCFLYPHQINPVTKGVRYTIVSWLV